MSISALLEDFERVGGRLTIEGGQVEVQYPEGQRKVITPVLATLREHRAEVMRLLQDRLARTTAAPTIPQRAILIAPRFDSRPLTQVPQCWCCQAPYRLDRIQALEGKQYAHLEPRCGCLDTAQAIKCCGLCTEHCNCRTRQKVNNCPRPGGSG